MDNKQRNKLLLKEFEEMYQRGEDTITNIQRIINSKQASELSPGELEVLQVTNKSLNRRFRGQEAASMVGVSLSAIYQAEKDGRLGQPDIKSNSGNRKIRSGYTIGQINEMRKVFGTLPRRGKGKKPVSIGVLNLKGGSWKTTISWLLSHYLAEAGYRVLAIDTDPQGSLTFLNGYRPDIDVTYWDTVAPYILKDVVGLQEEGLDPEMLDSLAYAVRKTYWPNIDIIPGCMELLRIDLELPILTRRLDAVHEEMFPGTFRTPDHIEYLREGIATVSDDYDIIIMDGTPSLNLSTMNVVTACDVTLIPTPAQMSDYASTLQFTNLILQTIDAYSEIGYYPPMPEVYYGITKFSDSVYSEWMGKIIRKTFKDRVLDKEAHNSDEIGKAGTQIRSIYEINPNEANNPQGLKKAKDRYDEMFSEVLNQIIKPHWESDDRLDEKTESSVGSQLMMEGII